VIGAGPAGLGAALALGDSAIVLESRETVAGLCGTVTLDGAIFDLGGHSFHTPHPAMRCLVFDALEMEEQNRDAWCWLNGEWVRYPFQQHFSELADSDSRHACQISLDAAGGWQDAANFHEYLASSSDTAELIAVGTFGISRSNAGSGSVEMLPVCEEWA
jgi:phytoene dehydrogenase-like protein